MILRTLTAAMVLPVAGTLLQKSTPPRPDAPTTTRPSAIAARMYWADYDADGRRDAYVVQPDGTARLLRGTEAGYQDVTHVLGLAPEELPSGAAWEDFDADGHLDLFLFSPAGSVHLLHGDGVAFAECTERVGLGELGGVTEAGWFDADGDGRPDLHVVLATGHRLFANRADGTFEALDLPLPASLVAVAGAAAPADQPEREPGVAPDPRRTSAAPGSPPTGGGGGQAALGGGTPPTATVTPLPGGLSTAALPICAPTVVDQANGSCLEASSVPALGMLYPISEELYVDAGTGFVGIGTASPGSFVTVDGSGSSTDELRYVAPGSSSGYVAITSLGGLPGFLVRTNDDLNNHTMAFANDSIVLNPKGGNAEFRLYNDGQLDFWAPEKGVRKSHVNYGTNGDWFIRSASTSGNVYLQDNGGNVGIGTTSPAQKLSVNGNVSASKVYPGFGTGADPTLRFGDGSETTGLSSPDADTVAITTASTERVRVAADGNVGIGTSSPAAKLTLDGGSLWLTGTHGGGLPAGAGAGIRIFNDDQTGKSQIYAYDYAAGQGLDLYLGTAGTKTSVSILEIRGGADLVEGFETTEEVALEPGTVVVIDAENPGALRGSTTPYDFKVAGVVSGAGGIEPGIHLGQEGLLDGDTKVAMTGRVYVKASAENGAIRPGDRLTTASVAGHAMKATDASRSDGAVIGKAMSALDAGTGLVLVLVNLQ